MDFPEPTSVVTSRTEVFVGYLDYFRAQVIGRVTALAEAEARASRLPSGWTPLELLRHLMFVERRWLEWGFENPELPDPWGDRRGERWSVPEHLSVADVVTALQERGTVSRAIIHAHDLQDVGRPSERWDGAEPATLERVLFHLLQEYARHAGHLDIVCELAGGPTGE